MADIYQAQLSFNVTSNLPEDRSTNTIFFTGGAASEPDAILEIQQRIAGFVNALQPLYSNLVTTSGHTLKIYDALAPAPREPLAESSFSFSSAPTGAPLPTECAICLSFKGPVVPGGGESLATNRGRIYIGPVSVDDTLAISGRITTGAQQVLADAGELLLGNGTDTTWCVFSRKLQSAIPITEGWVDNEYDTQRRRGRDSTERVVWPS